MYTKSILAVIMVLALVTVACSISIDLPRTNIQTGPLVSEDISVPVPDTSGTVELELNFGAGELILSPGAQDALVTGETSYNVPDFKPNITTSGNRVQIETGDVGITGLPNFGDDRKNEWDLKLSDTPMNLRIQAGAYQGRWNLGGLALEGLEISDGAADVELDFSEANQVEMRELRYETGASNVELRSLANANFDRMVFRSGAGNYTLDFSGELQRDARVQVESGISQVTLIVPEGVQVRVTFNGGLTNIDALGGWQVDGNSYLLEGSGPALEIEVDMGAGNLQLRTN